jgi:NCS1 nucleoside transporter family
MAHSVSSTADPADLALFERRGIEPVPADSRFGTAFSQFRIWFGANAVVSALFVGALGPIVFGLSAWGSLTAIFVGTLVSALAVGFASTLGPRTGMVQILFSRFTFGYWIGRVIALFNSFYCYAWSAVNLVTGTAAVQLAFVLMGISLLGTGRGSYITWVIVIAAVTTLVSVIGYNLVHGWEKYSTYASLVVFAVITIAVLLHHPNAGASTSTGVNYVKSWIGMALTAFGFGIGWIPYVSDYSRKLPANVRARDVFAWATLGLTLSATWVEGLGALLTTTAFKAVSGGDVVHGISAILGNNGFVVIGLLIVGLSTVSNNIPNDYTGGLSIQAAGIHVHRWIVTLIGGVLSALGAILFLQNFSGKLEAFLLMISYWVGAWFVLIAYNFVKRGGRYNVPDWDNPDALPTGIGPTIAFVAALIAAWLGMIPAIPEVTYNVLGQGIFGTRVGVDLGFILAIATALIIRAILDVALPSRGERMGSATQATR